MTMLQIRMRYTCMDAEPVLPVSTVYSNGSKVWTSYKFTHVKSAYIARDQFLCATTNSVVSDPPQISAICDVVAQLIYLPNSRRVYMLTTSRSILLGTKKCDWHQKKNSIMHHAASTWDTPRHPALALSHSNFKRFRSPTFCRLCEVMYVLRAVSQVFWQRPRLHHLRFPLNSYHFKAWALGRPTVWDTTMDYVHLIFPLCTSMNDGDLELFGPSGWDDQLQ